MNCRHIYSTHAVRRYSMSTTVQYSILSNRIGSSILHPIPSHPIHLSTFPKTHFAGHVVLLLLLLLPAYPRAPTPFHFIQSSSVHLYVTCRSAPPPAPPGRSAHVGIPYCFAVISKIVRHLSERCQDRIGWMFHRKRCVPVIITLLLLPCRTVL